MLFNKSNNGFEELKIWIPSISNSERFETFITDLFFAEEELKKYIGKDLLTELHEHYISDDYNPIAGKIKDELVRRAQMSLALIAFRTYVMGNDVNHTGSGRRATIDNENEKLAWEWMIQRDDEALMQKSHRAVDALIACLDENNYQSWMQSDIMKKTREVLLYNTSLFDDVYPIDKSRRMYLLLLPFMKREQEQHIKPVLGQYYKPLLDYVQGSSSSSDTYLNLYNYAATPLALFTMAVAVNRLSVTLMPEGLVQKFSSAIVSKAASQPVKSYEKTQIVKTLLKEAESELSKLESQVTKLKPVEEEEEDTTVDTTKGFFRV